MDKGEHGEKGRDEDRDERPREQFGRHGDGCLREAGLLRRACRDHPGRVAVFGEDGRLAVHQRPQRFARLAGRRVQLVAHAAQGLQRGLVRGRGLQDLARVFRQFVFRDHARLRQARLAGEAQPVACLARQKGRPGRLHQIDRIVLQMGEQMGLAPDRARRAVNMPQGLGQHAAQGSQRLAFGPVGGHLQHQIARLAPLAATHHAQRAEVDAVRCAQGAGEVVARRIAQRGGLGLHRVVDLGLALAARGPDLGQHGDQHLPGPTVHLGRPPFRRVRRGDHGQARGQAGAQDSRAGRRHALELRQSRDHLAQQVARPILAEAGMGAVVGAEGVGAGVAGPEIHAIRRVARRIRVAGRGETLGMSKHGRVAHGRPDQRADMLTLADVHAAIGEVALRDTVDLRRGRDQAQRLVHHGQPVAPDAAVQLGRAHPVALARLDHVGETGGDQQLDRARDLEDQRVAVALPLRVRQA